MTLPPVCQPPVGRTIFVFNNIASDVFHRGLAFAALPLCLFPGIATGLPNAIAGGR